MMSSLSIGPPVTFERLRAEFYAEVGADIFGLEDHEVRYTSPTGELDHAMEVAISCLERGRVPAFLAAVSSSTGRC